MKKILLLLVIANISAFAYTSIDVSNAEFLANKWIINKQNDNKNYRFNNTITRAEAIKIALTLKGTASLASYTCKKYFSDTTANDWICRVVEMAADAWLITRANIKFRPQDTISRAEALAIMMKAGWVAVEAFNRDYFGGHMRESDVPWTDANQFWANWQRDVFFSFKKNVSIEIPGQGNGIRSDAGLVSYTYRPSESATRAEVFAFAKNILSSGDIKNVDSYIVELIDNPDVTKFRDEPKILYLKEWSTKIEIDRGYIDNYFILWDFLLYKWSLTWGTKIRIFSLKNMEIVDEVIWWEVSTDSSYIFGCAFESFCSIFSLEKQRMIYSTTLDESREYWELKYLWENRFNLPDKKIIDFNKTPFQIDAKAILYQYYWLISEWSLKTAYAMRLPSGMTYEKFESLYKNLSATIESYDNNYQTWQRTYNSIQIDDSAIKNLWNNTYEFLVEMTENGVKSTYKVKSKVDLENFTINNISSVKQ